MVKVTTSWDDGDVLDLRLGELLFTYGMTGTFYVTKNYRPSRLSDSDIRHLGSLHEIGAHTLTHPDLRTLQEIEKRNEIRGSKEWLEDILGSEVSLFCYPKGFYDESTVSVVKEAGFKGARTTRLGVITKPHDPFRIDTTLQVYPFPFRKQNASSYYIGKLFEPYKQRASGLYALGVSPLSMYSWLSTAKATFDHTQAHNGTFHLWGHSWEIEKYGMWEDLEKLCAYIKSKRHGEHVTNNGLLL